MDNEMKFYASFVHIVQAKLEHEIRWSPLNGNAIFDCVWLFVLNYQSRYHSFFEQACTKY